MGSFLSCILFPVFRIRRKSLEWLSCLPIFMNFSTTETGHGDMSLRAMKTQEPIRNGSFFLCVRNMARCVSANCRLSTVSLLRSSQRRNPKNPNANNAATWTSPRSPCSSLLITFFTWFTSKAFFRIDGLARILLPASATLQRLRQLLQLRMVDNLLA